MTLTLSRFDPTVTPRQARHIGAIAFPDASAIVIEPADPYLHDLSLRAPHAFTTGGAPTYVFDGQGILDELKRYGYITADLSVCWPEAKTRIDATSDALPFGRCLRWWGLDRGDLVPTVSLTWQPAPWLWALNVGASIVGIVLTVFAALAARRKLRVRRPVLRPMLLVMAAAAFLTLSAAAGVDRAQAALELGGLPSTLVGPTEALTGILVAGVSVAYLILVLLGLVLIADWFATRPGVFRFLHAPIRLSDAPAARSRAASGR